MKRISYILAIMALMLPSMLQAKISGERKTFEKRVVLEKGENMVGLSAMGGRIDSDNTEFLLLLNNMTFDGNAYRVSAGYSYAYHDNMSIGFRMSYLAATANIDNINLNLLSKDLNFDVKNAHLSANGLSATVFNRNYIGLDRKGTVGIYFEENMSYTWVKTIGNTQKPGTYTSSNKVNVSISPGLILFIIPCVSVNASISVVDLGYCWSTNYVDNENKGNFSKWNASAKFNIMNLNFGIIVHF